jgi:single-strand DNA-binding protein
MSNTITFDGNLTRDPELRYTSSGMPMCNFGVADNRRWKDNKSGEWQEKVVFHNCVIFGDMA